MEKVLKEPATVGIGTGGGVPDAASAGTDGPGTVGGGRRVNVEYEKAPWIEATVRSVLPETSANMYDMWFYVNHGRDDVILCQQHFNGLDDEVIPHDFMNKDLGSGKECIACRASEMSRDYGLRPPEYQRKMIVKTAARIRAFFNIINDEGTVVTDSQKDFVQFLKDITRAMVGNKGCEHGEILMKALSHFGTVRVPRGSREADLHWKTWETICRLFEKSSHWRPRRAHSNDLHIVSPKIMETSSTKTTSRWCLGMTSVTLWVTPTPQPRNAATWSKCGSVCLTLPT